MALATTYFKTFRGTDIAKLETEINNYLSSRLLTFGGIFNSISMKVSEPGEDQITIEIITLPGQTG